MATSVPLGIVSLKAEGAYAADKLYKKGMWVTSSGSSYAYINPTPSTGVPLTNTSHWQQIASKGQLGPYPVYASLPELTEADPDHAYIYVTKDTGKWYHYDGGWVEGGNFTDTDQTTAITAQLAQTMKLVDTSMSQEDIQTILNEGGSIKFLSGEYVFDFVNTDTMPICLDIPSGVKLEFENGAVIKCVPNDYREYRIFDIENKTDVTILNAVIQGDTPEHTGTSGEWGHGINVGGSENVILDGVEITDCWGDGIYVRESVNVKIVNSTLEKNRRHNITVISVEDLYIDHLKSIKTTEGNVSYGGMGIDFEQNHDYEIIKNVLIENSYFYNQVGSNIAMGMFPVENIVVRDSKIIRGNLRLINIKNGSCENNFFTGSTSEVGPINIRDAENIIIRGNVLEDNIRGIYGTIRDLKNKNITIENNKVKNTDFAGISMNQCENLSIINNVVESSGGLTGGIPYDTGILIRESDGAIVTGNTSQNNHKHGITVYRSKNVSITKNNIRDNQENGLMLSENSDDCIITDNVIIGNGQNGLTGRRNIYLQLASGCYVSNNFIRQGYASILTPIGIDISSNSLDCLVSGNDVFQGGVTTGLKGTFNAGSGNRNNDGTFSTTPN